MPKRIITSEQNSAQTCSVLEKNAQMYCSRVQIQQFQIGTSICTSNIIKCLKGASALFCK